MKTKTIAWILLLSLIPLAMIPFMLAAASVAPFSGKDGLLRECKFNEMTGEYDQCYWKWQQPEGVSIYY